MQPRRWTRTLEREFDRLAVKEALGTLEEREIPRFQRLIQSRRQLLCPRTDEEIRLERSRRAATMKALKKLEAYLAGSVAPK